MAGVPAYNEAEPILSDVTFEVGPGRVLGLLGRTGGGKTTITRLLFPLYDTDEGRLLLGSLPLQAGEIS